MFLCQQSYVYFIIKLAIIFYKRFFYSYLSAKKQTHCYPFFDISKNNAKSTLCIVALNFTIVFILVTNPLYCFYRIIHICPPLFQTNSIQRKTVANKFISYPYLSSQMFIRYSFYSFLFCIEYVCNKQNKQHEKYHSQPCDHTKRTCIKIRQICITYKR